MADLMDVPLLFSVHIYGGIHSHGSIPIAGL